MARNVILFLLIIGSVFNAIAGNNLSEEITECSPNIKSEFSVDLPTLDNSSGFTQIGIRIKSVRTPFEIYKIEWINCDTVVSLLEPFVLSVPGDKIENKTGIWHILLEFDCKNRFSANDEIRIYSDQGLLSLPLSTDGKYRRVIQSMKREFDEELDLSQSNANRAWRILGIVLCCAVIAVVAIGVAMRCRLSAKQRQLNEMALLIAERTDRNHELEKKVNELYNSRLDTLNMLCNEYFEKNDSEKIRLTLYNEVENHILQLRDKKSLRELETIVNTYLDGIITKVRMQLPELKVNDLNFLIYLFAGFSPRAVCIFTNIKIKNFYNRRSRLKERILASDAPDRELFVSKM